MKRTDLRVGQTYAVKVSGQFEAAVVIDLATPLYSWPNDWAKGVSITPELGDSPVHLAYATTAKPFANSVATMVAVRFVQGGQVEAVASKAILGTWDDHEQIAADVKAEADKRLNDRIRAQQLRQRLRQQRSA